MTSRVPIKVVEDQIRRFFAGHAVTEHQWMLGPVPDAMPEFRILCAGPGPRTGCWTYLSIGASLITHDNSGLLEFFIVAPHEDLRHVELVSMVAWYHKTKGLGWGHTIPIGYTWLPRLSPLAAPITTAEREFKVTHDIEALEQRFDNAGIEYWDACRKSVV